MPGRTIGEQHPRLPLGRLALGALALAAGTWWIRNRADEAALRRQTSDRLRPRAADGGE